MIKKFKHIKEFFKYRKKNKWKCILFPHKLINADNEVMSGCDLCINCGILKVRKEHENNI